LSQQKEAERLKARGYNAYDIGERLGVSLGTVRRLLDPRAAALSEKWARERAERRTKVRTATWMTATHADGPSFVAFLRRAGCTWDTMKRDAFDRRIRRWEAGSRVRFYEADATLARFGLHPSQVPEDVWEEGDSRGLPLATAAERLKAVEEAPTMAEAARRLGLERRVLAQWVRRQQQRVT